MPETALVTGGETGIGLAITQALAGAGYDVKSASRRGGYDLTDPESIDRLVRELDDSGGSGGSGGLDLLVNNAGLADAAPLAKTSDEMWQRHFDLNVTAAFRLCRAALPLLHRSARPCIINMASTAALAGAPYIAAYAASKHALLGLTRVLAVELKKIRVHAVCPGFVDTPLTDRSVQNIAAATGRSEEEARAELAKQNASGRLITPAEVAQAVVDLAQGDTTGEEVILD